LIDERKKNIQAPAFPFFRSHPDFILNEEESRVVWKKEIRKWWGKFPSVLR